MKTFLPNASFTYPEGSITRFEAGIMSLPVQDEEADLLEAKGLGTATAIDAADAKPEQTAEPPVEPAAPAPEASDESKGDQPET